MSRVCEITGSKVGVGNNVSHSNRHTKRTFRPNLQTKTYQSDILGRTVTLTLTTRAIRTLDKYNGFDGFMLQVKNVRVREGFSVKATQLRNLVLKRAAAKASA
ncbi:MAG: 50S ribosomal protein L28 [Pseudomonas fluorescens]|nr:MAG: 50S ribosomal protein L28 [Pseudomonas fluorescens]